MSCLPETTKKGAETEKEQAARALPEGVPPLTSLYLYISGSCNLACRHCWIEPDFRPDARNGRFLEFEYLRKAVTEAKPLGLRSVKLTGGEPMLHPRFREIVEWLDSEGMPIIIETNGTLVDDEMARFLKSRPAMNFISVSLDGARAETHEELRGVPGSYERAVGGIKALAAAGFRPQMICTLHTGNVAEIDDILDLAGLLGCGSVKFNHIQRIGRGERLAQERGLTIETIIWLYRKLVANRKNGHSPTIFFDIPMAFRPIRALLKGVQGYCSVLNILGVLSGGEMSLCGVGVTVPELIYGNLEKDKLGDIWREAAGLRDLRSCIPGGLEGICGNCLHKDLCLGDCLAYNYYESRTLTGAYYFCRYAEERGLFPASRKRRLNGDMNGKETIEGL